MAPTHDRTTMFQQYSPRLFGIAYRMLGSRADAEDVLQEAYLRWHQTDTEGVQTPEAWLVTTVSRLCIDRPRFAVSDTARIALLNQFVGAVNARDQDALLALFAGDATWTSDGGGQVVAARRVVRGAARLTRFVLGIARRYQGRATYQVAPINGEAGVIIRLDGRLDSILSIDTDGTRILAVFNILNPQKLQGLRLPGYQAPWPSAVTE